EWARAPRSLSGELQQQIADSLAPFGKLPFAFVIKPDPEPSGFMEDIGAALKLAGWSWVPYPVAAGAPGAGLGYSIRGSPTVGTMFSLIGLQIEIPTAHADDWGPTVIALLNALNKE